MRASQGQGQGREAGGGEGLPVGHWLLPTVALLGALAACRSNAGRGGVEVNSEMLVGVSTDITPPSPLAVGGLGATVAELAFRPLLRLKDAGGTEGDLAERFSWSSDGGRLTVNLRASQRFSDGSAVGAGDVVDSFRRSKSAGVWGFDELAGCEVVDSTTVVLRPVRPFLIPGAAFVGVAKRGSTSVGAGPYIVGDHGEDSLTMTANPTYQGPVPGVHSIRFRRFVSSSEQWSNLLARKVDLITFVPWNKFDLLSLIPTVRPEVALSNVVAELRLRDLAPPFDRADVRLALSRAIDREELLRSALRGQGQPAKGIVWPRAEGFDATLEDYDHAPEALRQLLASEGATTGADGILRWGGQPLRLDVDYWQGGPGLEQLALLVQRQLAAAGVEGHFRGIEIAAHRARVLGRGPLAILRFRHAASDVLFDEETRSLPGGAPTDLPSAAAVEQAVRRAQRRLRDEAPAIYLVWLNRLDVIDRRFCGLPSLPDGPEGRLDRVHPCAPGEDR